MNKRIYEDAFCLLCGTLIGEGIHRKVFECKLRPDLVVKVENGDDYRSFANVIKQRFWDEHQEYKKVSQWLAPCEYLSPDGRILLQRKVVPIADTTTLPKEILAFLTDLKPCTFGMLEGRLVCVDYAGTIQNPSARMKKVDWAC